MFSGEYAINSPDYQSDSLPDLAASNEIPLSALGSFGSNYSPVNESSSSDESQSDNLCYISSSDNNSSSSSSQYEISDTSDMSSHTNSDFDMSSDTCPPAELSATEMLQVSLPDSPLVEIIPLWGPEPQKRKCSETMHLCANKCYKYSYMEKWSQHHFSCQHNYIILKNNNNKDVLPIIVINACTFVLYDSL